MLNLGCCAGAIVGGVTGGIVGLALILALAVYLCKRHQRPRKSDWNYVQRDDQYHTNGKLLPMVEDEPLARTQPRSTSMEEIPLVVEPYPSTNPFTHPQDPVDPRDDGPTRARSMSDNHLEVEQGGLLREPSRGSSTGRISDVNSTVVPDASASQVVPNEVDGPPDPPTYYLAVSSGPTGLFPLPPVALRPSNYT